ncbi:Ras family protein [Oesophagostomum dentatum]|uniref:small monomeric GTPase n=1 Tax=Oesophagostomum dentatum TaxID=61180 RepID=A0A0B1TR58_OESDE|nr:Ras family protein [Oesophagostomum dentatum]
MSCPTCRTDTQVPIRNIALEQVVEEFKISQRRRSSCYAKSAVEYGDQDHSLLFRRQLLRASRRRARFSITGPERVVDGPGSSVEALPTSSREGSYRSLNSSPHGFSETPNNRVDATAIPYRVIRRNSHDSWSGRMGQLYSTIHGDDTSTTEQPSDFKRASLLRRSICAIRKSVGRRPRKRDNETAKVKKSKWKRLFPFRIRKVHPTHGRDTPFYGPLCVYSGFGRTFERINPGEEIAIAVFGRRGVGKTSLLDNATLSCEGRHGVAPMGLSERMRLGGKQNLNEYRLAHMTSITARTRQQCFVIDLIDAEFEDDHSVAHTSYMKAADAAIVVYSTVDSASLLMAMSINRQLAAVSESKKPCVLLANVIDDVPQRYVTREMGERTARNIRATYIEANLLSQDGGVYAAVEHLCRAVVSKRKNADANQICAIM